MSIGQPEGRLPTFVIIGAARAGTTSLTTYLTAHPDVFVAPAKELNFFDREYWRGVEWYRAQFAGARSQRAIGEGSVSYMFNQEAPERMAELLPDARLIAILRNPVDRAYSHYWFSRAWGAEQRTFEEAVFADPDPNGFGYFERGRYLPQLLRVCEYFKRESLLVLLLEDLYASPEETFSALCTFIGVDERTTPRSVGRVFNAARTYRWEGLQRLLRRIDVRWKIPPALVRPLNALNRRAPGYPPMDPRVRERLRALYSPDNVALADWLGRDLSAWSHPGESV